MQGIEATKKMIMLLVSIGAITEKALKDDKVDVGDMTLLLELTPKLAPAAATMIEIPGEVSDLSEVEIAELNAFFKSEFNLTDEEVESKVEAGIDLAYRAYELVNSIIDFVKSMQKVPTHAAPVA